MFVTIFANRLVLAGRILASVNAGMADSGNNEIWLSLLALAG